MKTTTVCEPLEASDIPTDFPVRPLLNNEHPAGRTTCGSCGLSWNDDISTSMTPTPSARCPFEYFHEYEEQLTDELWCFTCGGIHGKRVTAVAIDASDPENTEWECVACGEYIQCDYCGAEYTRNHEAEHNEEESD